MKNFFNTKSIRERVLMTAFLLIAVVTWGSSLLGRTRSLQTDWTVTSRELGEQLASLSSKTQVEERAQKITAQLDPSRTLNATQAFTEVNRLAQGLAPDMVTLPPVGKTIFTIHSLTVTIKRTSMDPLVKFYKELSAKAPYLGIEQCTITMDRSAPGQITAVFRVYSVEVLNSATKS